MSQVEIAKVKSLVQEKMKALEEVDIYSGDTEGISQAFSDIFSRADANRAATSDLANYFTKRNFRGAQDSVSFKSVTELASALKKYDPSKYDLTEPTGIMKFMPAALRNALPQGVDNYMRSFKEAQGQIELLMDGVAGVAEDGIKAKQELKTFDGKLLKLAKELRVQFETFNEVAKCVDEYLADLTERDPMKADKVRSELIYRVAEARMDTLTTLLQAMNGSILVSSLVKTQDMIITGAQRASSSGRLILTINQTSAAAASEQSDARELLETVNNTIGNMTEGTAKMVNDHVKKMKELASAPMGQAEKLKAAFALGFNALDELRDVQIQVAKRMEDNIASMETVYQDASARIKSEATAVGAFKEIVDGSASIAAIKERTAEEKPAAPSTPKI
jgi:uncharacterized protein YaaN involved in tellurite resistance